MHHLTACHAAAWMLQTADLNNIQALDSLHTNCPAAGAYPGFQTKYPCSQTGKIIILLLCISAETLHLM